MFHVCTSIRLLCTSVQNPKEIALCDLETEGPTVIDCQEGNSISGSTPKGEADDSWDDEKEVCLPLVDVGPPLDPIESLLSLDSGSLDNTLKQIDDILLDWHIH